MNWPNKKLFSVAAFVAVCASLAGCGVKGDPLPPEKPIELGRGRPTYKRATEGLKIEKNKREDEDDEQE